MKKPLGRTKRGTGLKLRVSSLSGDVPQSAQEAFLLVVQLQGNNALLVESSWNFEIIYSG